MSRHQPYAYALAFRLLQDHDDACDAVQESFVKVWNHIDTYRPEVRFTTWLHTIVTRTCYDRIRHESRRRTLFSLFRGADDDPPEPTANDLHTRTEQRDICSRILDATRSLPPRERIIFRLRDLQECTIREIGEMLGMSDGAVRVHLCNARKRIRMIVGPMIGGEDR